MARAWRGRGAHEGREFAALTDTMQRGTFDLSTGEHRQVKHIGQRQNLRDSMTTMELLLTALSEETARELHQAHDSQGDGELHRDAGQAGEVGGAARHRGAHRAFRRQRRELQDATPGQAARVARAAVPAA